MYNKDAWLSGWDLILVKEFSTMICEGKYCSVILDVETGEERVLPMPVYTVSTDGKTALSLDFSQPS